MSVVFIIPLKLASSSAFCVLTLSRNDFKKNKLIELQDQLKFVMKKTAAVKWLSGICDGECLHRAVQLVFAVTCMHIHPSSCPVLILSVDVCWFQLADGDPQQSLHFLPFLLSGGGRGTDAVSPRCALSVTQGWWMCVCVWVWVCVCVCVCVCERERERESVCVSVLLVTFFFREWDGEIRDRKGR